MDDKPTLNYEPAQKTSVAGGIAEGCLFVGVVVLCVVGMVPLMLAIMMTYHLLTDDIPTRDFWSEVSYGVIWWLLALAMYWPALRLMLKRR